MFYRDELEERLESQCQAKCRPVRESQRASQSYSPRFEKRQTHVSARNGIQRRGTRKGFAGMAA
jgi:hypothetical protein